MIDCVALSTQTPPLHLHNTPYILQQNALLHVHVSVVYQSLYPYSALSLYIHIAAISWLFSHCRSEPSCMRRQLGGKPKYENHQSWEWSGSQQTGQQLQSKKPEEFCTEKESEPSWGHWSNCCLCVRFYQFGFRKWKSHVTERPFEGRSDVVKELYSELNVIKPHSGPGMFC